MLRTILLSLLCGTTLAACSDESATPAPLSPALEQGKTVVQGLCINCHGQGINNAPILGNPKMWEKRIAQGEDVLIGHALNGFNMMPPRGGNPALTDEQIQRAVQYMISLVPAS